MKKQIIDEETAEAGMSFQADGSGQFPPAVSLSQWCASRKELKLEFPTEEEEDIRIKRLNEQMNNAGENCEQTKNKRNECKKKSDDAVKALCAAAEEVGKSKASIEVTVRNEPKEGGNYYDQQI
jgi:hypothetical protein